MPGSTPYPVNITFDFLFPNDLDVAQFWVGKIEYEDIFGGRKWKNFCIQIVAGSSADYRVPSYQIQYCPTAQDGGSYPTKNDD